MFNENPALLRNETEQSRTVAVGEGVLMGEFQGDCPHLLHFQFSGLEPALHIGSTGISENLRTPGNTLSYASSIEAISSTSRPALGINASFTEAFENSDRVSFRFECFESSLFARSPFRIPRSNKEVLAHNDN